MDSNRPKIVAVTDNVVITACEDGVIRAVHLYPHRFVGMKIHLYKKMTKKVGQKLVQKFALNLSKNRSRVYPQLCS